MKRRAFLQFAVGSAVAMAATEPARPIKRMTRLYPVAPLPGAATIRIVPDLLPLDDKLVSLQRPSDRISAVAPDGTVLWQHQVPQQGQFTTLAGMMGEAVLIQSMGGRLYRLNPVDGLTSPVKGKNGLVGRMYHAGQNYMIQPSSLGFDLGNVGQDSIDLLRSTGMSGPSHVAQVDPITPSLAAVTAMDGSAMWTVEIPSGRVQSFEPDTVTDHNRFVATGTDRERSRLLWLFPGKPHRIVAIDSEGGIEPYATCEVGPGRFPARVWRSGGRTRHRICGRFHYLVRPRVKVLDSDAE